jgi:aminoglycoside phosphotransferase (APT) family kinase protein
MQPPRSDCLHTRLAAFISAVESRRAQVRFMKRFPGGFSWQTSLVDISLESDGARPAQSLQAVLRLGHENGLLSPYSVEPERRVFEALAGSEVPVPQVLWHSDDAGVLGAPFLVMTKAEGVERSPFSKTNRERTPVDDRIASHFTEVLAALHNHRWEGTAAAGLSPNPTTEDAARAQARRWSRLIDESGVRPLPILRYARHWLDHQAPAAPRIVIVHGDYRAGNFLEADGRITAVLDWELVHLGDPHEDIAWASLKFLSGGGLVSGLVPRDEFIERYERLTGIALSSRSWRYYEVLGLYKICAMNLRAASRVEAGSAPDARMTALGFGLPQLQGEIVRLLKEAA